MTDAAPSHHPSFIVNTQTPPADPPLEVYHLSHDLRGPLNAVLGFCELLLEEIEGPINDIQRADLTAIYQSAQNLLTLISNMVDLSKLEADRILFDFGPVGLARLVEEIVSVDEGVVQPEQSLELVVLISPTLPSIRGDRDRVKQMIRNLLRFVTKLKPEGQIKLTARAESDVVTLRVELDDNGNLSPAELAELFDLRVKVDSSGRSELGRGGLGLPLARFLAEKHQGRAWAESQNDNKLALCLSLPIM